MNIELKSFAYHYHTPPFNSSKTNSTTVDTIDTLHTDFLWFQMCPLRTKHNFQMQDMTGGDPSKLQNRCVNNY